MRGGSPAPTRFKLVSPILSYFAIALAAASWGTWSVFLRLAQADAPLSPALATFVVLATIAAVLLPMAAAESRRRPPRSRRAWVLLGLFGLSDALNCAMYFAAFQATSVAVATLTHYLAPLMVALTAPLILKEPRRPGTGFAVILALAGLLSLLEPWRMAGTALPEGAGAVLGAGSAIFFAAGVLFNKHLSRHFGVAELLVYHMPTALIALAVLVPVGGWHVSRGAAAWLMAGAIGPGAIAGVLFVRALAQVSAARAAVLTYIEPLTAVMIATLAWGQPFTVWSVLGGAAILLAGYWVVREPEPATAEVNAAVATD
jgi:drug/metabolite transporter (DMT)-like permease